MDLEKTLISKNEESKKQQAKLTQLKRDFAKIENEKAVLNEKLVAIEKKNKLDRSSFDKKKL